MRKDFESCADLVPAGAPIVQAIRIVEFIDESGEMRYSYSYAGESQFSGTIGLLEIVKASVLHDYLHNPDTEVDDAGPN